MKRTAQAALALLIFTTLFSCHNLVVKLMPPEGDKITSFILADEVALISDNSITVTVPPSTDISALVPLIRAQDGATVIPITYEYITQAFPNAKAERLVSDWLSTNNKTDWALKVLKENPTFTVPELTTPINFTMPTLFAVISGQGTTRLYTVTVSGGKVMLPIPTEKNKLFSFTVDGQIGQSVIDHGSPETGSGSVTFTVPQSVNLRSLIPTVTASENAFVLPLTFNYLLRSFINADLFDLFMGYYLASDKSAYLQQKMQNLEGFVMPSKTLDLPIDFSATVPFAVVAWDYSISLYEVKATRVNTDAQLTDFILSKALNPELVRDAQGTINEAKKTVSMTAWLPAEYTPAKQYIPTFTLAGQSDSANLSVDSTRIENNVTAIDCTSPQKTLSVSRTINGVTTTTDYTLLIDYKEDPDTVRSITDLRFTKKNNPSLLVNCITAIHDAKEIGTIKVSIPHTGAQPPRLVVDYISGGVVTDEFMQSIYSGTTTDTPHTRTLVCTSRDGTLQRRYTLLIDYIAVEGTGLPELQSFSFSALINKDLSKAVTARIDHVNNVIFAEIPYTSASYPRILIPEFSASGTVSVTSAPQISGISGQDFSRLVTYTVTSFWDPNVTKQYSVQLAYSKAVVQNTHVLFYANGGSVTPEYVSVQKGSSVNSLPTPERVNFTFAGWYTQITGGQKINAPYTPQTDTTLYAQWEGTSYTLSFNANGGTGTMSPQTFTSGVAQNLSANTFSKTGNYFVGWNTAQDGSGTYYADGAIPTASSGNVELYAQWSNAPVYTITFYSNYTGSTETQNQSAQENTSVLLQENRFTRQGYTFKEWNTHADGTGTPYTDKAPYSLGSANTQLYAQWTINIYTLTFNANNGTSSPSTTTQSFTYTVAQNLNANAFTKTGYSFKEWSTLSNGGGDTFTDRQSYTIKDAPVTLYAQWTANTYTVTFDANGTETSGTMAHQTFTYDTTTSLSPNAFKKVGHYFTGWTTAANGTGGAYADGALYETPAINITLYAQWKIKDIIYVKSNAAGRNDGSSWTNAYTTLEAALEERTKVPYDIFTEEDMYIGPVYVSIYIAATADGYTPAIEGTSFTLEHNTKFYGGFSGTEVELKDRPAGAKTALKGNGDRVLMGQNGLFVTIDGFAVSGGKTALQGGGIYIGTWGSRNRIAITNCDFTNNSAGSHGGAVYAANIDITGCTFSENKVEGPTVETYISDYSAYDMGGGALYIVNGTVTDCSFSKNKAISTDPEGHAFYPTARGGVGGAVYAYKTTLTNCVFTENEANLVEPTTAAESINRGAENTGRGGAVYANKSTVTESVFEKNTVGRSGTTYYGKNSEDKGGGGGIFADNDSTISSCTFTQNMSKNGSIEALFTGGGALYTNKSTVTDCRFSNNTATANGGGIFANNWTSSKNNTINNCTFENNTAGGYGGGISGLGLTLTNSIFKNNNAQKGTAYGATTNYSQYLAHFTVAFSGNTFHTNTAPSSSVFYFETFSTAGGSGVRTFKITGLNPQTNKDGSGTLLPAVVYTLNSTYNANGFYITGEGITVE